MSCLAVDMFSSSGKCEVCWRRFSDFKKETTEYISFLLLMLFLDMMLGTSALVLETTRGTSLPLSIAPSKVNFLL